jgi:hypothetical protein
MSTLQEKIKNYIPARLQQGKSLEIVFYAYNPEKEKLDRKRIRINHVKKHSERMKYANELMKRINENLAAGWNPFMEPEAGKSYTKLKDVAKHFLNLGEKKLRDDVIREETFNDYKSYLKNFMLWLEEKGNKDILLYKVTKSVISDFLEHIYVERGRTAQTRNNY